MPMHFPHRARLDIQMSSCNRLGNGEVLAVNYARFSAAALLGWSVEHVVSVLMLRLLERPRLLLVDAVGDRAWDYIRQARETASLQEAVYIP